MNLLRCILCDNHSPVDLGMTPDCQSSRSEGVPTKELAASLYLSAKPISQARDWSCPPMGAERASAIKFQPVSCLNSIMTPSTVNRI